MLRRPHNARSSEAPANGPTRKTRAAALRCTPGGPPRIPESMRRLLAGSLVSASILSAVACGSFLPGDPSAGPDGAAGNDSGDDGSTSSDGSASTDGAPSDGAATDGAPVDAFCAARPNARLCDDFEQPGRQLSLAAPAAPWTRFESSGPQIVSLGPGNASPRAFSVKGLMGSGTYSRLIEPIEVAGKKMRLAFQVRFDTLSIVDAGPSPLLTIASVRFPGSNAYASLVFHPYRPLGVTVTEPFIRSSFTSASGGVTYFPRPQNGWPPPGSGWIPVVIELDAGSRIFAVRVGDSQPAAIQLDPPGPAEIALGADFANAGAEVDVALDDIVVDIP